MKKLTVAKRFQNPEENLLMEIGILAKQTEGLIDLSIGDPDLDTNETIIDYAALSAKKGHTHYTLSDGSPEFVQSVIDFYQKNYQLTFEKNQVRATVGVSHGMYLALLAILNPGDEVIIHEPFFSPYRDQVLLAGGTPVVIPTFEEEDFQLDSQRLKAAVTDKTKAIIINSPNNPTGAVFTKDTMKKIADIAIENELYILSDEIYEAFTFYETFTPMATYAPDNTITFSGFSKAFAMTGWRIGYMISPSPVNDVARYLNENISYAANSLSQKAGTYALDHFDELVPDVVAVFKERLEYIEQRVAAIPFLSMGKVKGTMYAYINTEKTGMTSVAFVEKLLKETQVLMIPGTAFGVKTGMNHVRLAATQSKEQLAKAFDRIEKKTF